MSTTAVRIRNIGKQYQLGTQERGYTTFREAVTRAVKTPFERFRKLSGRTNVAESFWALQDVSFDIQEGEVIGIIGRNGAGKSTLLKILSQITEPTTGEIELHGRVGSLLEVGTGFHPELSGRENIYLNGALLGMKRAEISRRFDEIVAFAEIDKFLDTPVKRYSSGMYVRLAFAVAAHLEPEILIVDEVLAVGDASFQQKCLGKMSETANAGRTVLLVSHNMAAVESLCSKAVVFEAGRVGFVGSPLEAIREYFQFASAGKAEGIFEESSQGGAERVAWIARATVTDAGLDCAGRLAIGATLEFRIDCKCMGTLQRPGVGIVIENQRGQRITTFHTKCGSRELLADLPTKGFRLICRVPHFALAPGQYNVTLGLSDGSQSLEKIHNALTFTILTTDFFNNGGKLVGGVVYCEQDWSVETL